MQAARPTTVLIVARVACVTAVAITGVASIAFVLNEARLPVGWGIQLLGSLVCTWAALFYRAPDTQAENGAVCRDDSLD